MSEIRNTEEIEAIEYLTKIAIAIKPVVSNKGDGGLERKQAQVDQRSIFINEIQSLMTDPVLGFGNRYLKEDENDRQFIDANATNLSRAVELMQNVKQKIEASPIASQGKPSLGLSLSVDPKKAALDKAMDDIGKANKSPTNIINMKVGQSVKK